MTATSAFETTLHLPGTEGANVVYSTPLMKRVRASVRLLSSHKGIIVIDGKPGNGKTFVANVAAREVNLPCFRLDLTGETSVNRMFGRLYEAITGEYPKGMPLFLLGPEIESLLDQAEAMLIVDECQWADRRLLRVLRATYDHARSQRFLLVLVGQRIGRVLTAKEPGLASRVSRSVEASPIKPSNLVATLREYHPVFANTSPETIVRLEEWAKGNWRRWAHVLEAAIALNIDSTTGISPASVSHIRQLIGDLGGAAEA